MRAAKTKNKKKQQRVTRVDRMNTASLITKPWWRQAVRLQPTGAQCRCYEASASDPNGGRERGCRQESALENIYGRKAVILISTHFLCIV